MQKHVVYYRDGVRCVKSFNIKASRTCTGLRTSGEEECLSFVMSLEKDEFKVSYYK